MFNPNMYRNNSFYNNSSPFNIPRMKQNDVFFTPKKGMNLNRTLQGVEKGIDTINSIIPLYQKVTPLISSSKDIVSKLKTTFIKKKTNNPSQTREKVDVEIVDQPKNIKDPINNIKKEETKPNKPYF